MPNVGSGSVRNAKNAGLSAGTLLAVTVGLLALPSAVLAFSNRFETRQSSESLPAKKLISPPSAIAANLAAAFPAHLLNKHNIFQFTPAGIANRPERSVTVAVRLDPRLEDTILVRGVPRRVAKAGPETVELQLAPTAFSLGVARGYHSFAQNLVPSAPIRTSDMPDLASLKGSIVQSSDGPSRFNPKILLDQKQATGRAPRTFSGAEEVVDVGGSYRVTRNLDVTAGLRYSQEHDRLRPLTDKKKDNQAVYVGTQFRF
jgi:hypothetical protein